MANDTPTREPFDVGDSRELVECYSRDPSSPCRPIVERLREACDEINDLRSKLAIYEGQYLYAQEKLDAALKRLALANALIDAWGKLDMLERCATEFLDSRSFVGRIMDQKKVVDAARSAFDSAERDGGEGK